MEHLPRAVSESPDRRFRYIAGDPSLDLVNTVAWTEADPEHERLTDYAALLRWAEGAGVVSKARARRLRTVAAADPGAAVRAHEDALRLRWTLWRVFAAAAAGRTPAVALDDLNRRVVEAAAHRRLEPVRTGEAGVQWVWTEGDEDLGSPLWPVTLAAAWLLASPEARRVRRCAGDACGWMYVDRSRNGLRRWCEMETCGTAAKTQRRAERREAAQRKGALRKRREP